MDKTYDDSTIQHQYDALIKNVLKHEAKSYLRELQKRAEQNSKLQELFEIQPFIQIDQYECECFCFEIGKHKIYVENELLSKALHRLPDNQKTAVLLFYFENMSDEEISREMHLNRSTVFRNRKKALSQIKSYMENVRYD